MEIGLFGLRANQMILENDIPCNFLLDWDYFSWGGGAPLGYKAICVSKGYGF